MSCTEAFYWLCCNTRVEVLCWFWPVLLVIAPHQRFLTTQVVLRMLQDEDLGLAPPNFNNGRSVTGRRSSMASALPAKVLAAESPVQPAAVVQPSRSAVPPVAGASSAAPVAPQALTSSSTAQPVPAAAAVAAPRSSAPVAQPGASAAPASQQQQPRPLSASVQPAASAAGDAAPAALTGSAAILAKLRQQRQSTSVNSSSSRETANSSMAQRDGVQAKITVLYASQTGTGQEIARSIHAECAAKGLPSQVMSMNELGFDNLTPQKTPIVVVVASSTGG